MKLVTFEWKGRERVGALVAGGKRVVDRERGIQWLSCVGVGYREKDDLYLYHQRLISFFRKDTEPS